MKQNIMFIIFPGNTTTGKYFKLNYVGKKPLKGWDDIEPELNNSNFIPELKKLGKVHFVEPNYYNIKYYSNWMIKNKKQYLHKKNINFTIKDLNLEKYCDKVYNELKDFKGKFVLIGHSRGSKWLYTFSQKYSNRCLINFIIDGSLSPNTSKSEITYVKTEWRKRFKSKNFKDIKEDDIQQLIKEVKNYNQESLEKLQLYLDYYILTHFPKVKKINVKTISFRNLYIKSEYSIYNFRKQSPDKIKSRIDKEEYFLKYNPKNYRTIYFVNKTHFPHAREDSREIILNTIKGYLL